MTRRRETLLFSVGAALAVFAIFLEYVPPFRRVHLWSDIVGYSYPLSSYAFASLRAGRIPLWDPSIYCGISFVGNVQAALFYPPAWLLYAAVWKVGRVPFQAVEILAFAHFWLAFVLSYGWLRGRARWFAATLGAAAFAFAGQSFYGLLHLGATCASAWLPLSLWGVDDAVRKGSSRPLWKVAAASALCNLAGYPASWIAFCGITVVYAFAGAGWRGGLRAAAVLVFSLLLVLPQLLPGLEAASLVELDPRYYPAQHGWTALLLAHAIPNWFDFNPGHPTYFDPGCMYFYVGLPVLFAVGGAAAGRRWSVYRQAVVTLAFAVAMANPILPFVRLVQRARWLSGTMHPNEFYLGVSAMAALITALAVEHFCAGKPRKRLPVTAGAIVAMGLLGYAGWELRTSLLGGQFPLRGSAALQTVIGLALFTGTLFAIRSAGPRQRGVLVAVLLLATAIDFKANGSGRWFNAEPGDEDANHPAGRIAGVDDDAYRTMLANRQYRVATADDAGPAATDYRYWGLATPAGFDPLIPRQYRNAVERWTPFRTNREFFVDLHKPEMLRTLGVRYVLARRGSAQEKELAARSDFRRVGRGDVFCPVFEYRHAATPFGIEGGARIEATGWMPERREFRAASPGASRLFLVEQFHPGWRASINGRSVPVERWGGAFQSVSVPAGDSRVVFEFQPVSWKIGLAVSLIALGTMGWLVTLDGRTSATATPTRTGRSGDSAATKR